MRIAYAKSEKKGEIQVKLAELADIYIHYP